MSNETKAIAKLGVCINAWKRRDLLALPSRKWGEETDYDALLLTPTGKKHDSGFNLISIVGWRRSVGPVAQAAFCDDIEWHLPDAPRIGTKGEYAVSLVRMDCSFPSGIIRAWSDNCVFRVGMSLSTTRVNVIQRQK